MPLSTSFLGKNQDHRKANPNLASSSGLPVILSCKETGAVRHRSSLPYESASVQGLEWALEPPLRSLFSTRLNTFIATREEEGPFVMTNGCRTASVTSSPRRTKRPSTLTVGKVGWSVERETWCRLTLERQPSAGAGLALHQSRISMREIRASQTLDLLWQTQTQTQTALKGG